VILDTACPRAIAVLMCALLFRRPSFAVIFSQFTRSSQSYAVVARLAHSARLSMSHGERRPDFRRRDAPRFFAEPPAACAHLFSSRARYVDIEDTPSALAAFIICAAAIFSSRGSEA